MQDNNGKCKWCGLPMHVENPFNDYCGTTCKIAAQEESPLFIRRRRTRQAFLVLGAVYGLSLAFIDGNYTRFIPFYVAAGALAGWLVGIPVCWFLYFSNKHSKINLHK
jgi:hypothetical protein